MAYKLLGFAVWHGGKWYLRRRIPDAKRKVAIGGIALAVGVGALVAQRQLQNQ
jgi:hypothetical protein